MSSNEPLPPKQREEMKIPEEIAKLIQGYYKYHGADNGCAYSKSFELISDFQRTLKDNISTESAWIKELEENAEEKQMCDGYLIDEQEYCDENKVDFCPSMDGEQWVDLHGQFTIQQLQDLINHMKRYQNG
jgi:hypothetical protein